MEFAWKMEEEERTRDYEIVHGRSGERGAVMVRHGHEMMSRRGGG